jgi:hypothetical protein
MASPHQFFLSVINKGFNEGYGYQCVAGFKEFCKEVLGVNYFGKSICYGGNPSNYAYRIWCNFDSLGLGKYFDKVAPNQMVDGDWAIWNYGGKGNACPYSHIAMFRKDNGNGTGVFLGQNQGCNGGKFSQINISYSGLLGGLRPKIYHQKQGENVDQVLHAGSKVQIPGTFDVISVRKSDNTAVVRINGVDYRLSSTPLKEV